MKYSIQELKEAVNRLDKALAGKNLEDVETNTRWILNITQEIRSNFITSRCEVDEKPYAAPTNVNFKYINTIEFIYKPMHHMNIYEVDDVEGFVKERTEELIDSGSMEAHNGFWQEHEIVYGTVYGSLPKELLSVESIGRLKRCGWKEAQVEVLDIKQMVSDKEARQLVRDAFKHYIIIKETATKSMLVLKYLI